MSGEGNNVNARRKSSYRVTTTFLILPKSKLGPGEDMDDVCPLPNVRSTSHATPGFAIATWNEKEHNYVVFGFDHNAP